MAQIGMWIWSNALYNSRGNQINIAHITILQLLFNKSNQIKCWFLMRGKTRVPGEKPLRAEYRTNKLNPHMTPSAEIEPRPHWWKASALTTRPTLPMYISTNRLPAVSCRSTIVLCHAIEWLDCVINTQGSLRNSEFKKLRWLLQRNHHIKIELCVWLSVLRLFQVGHIV